MSDAMLQGVLRMPIDLGTDDILTATQFVNRARQAADRIDELKQVLIEVRDRLRAHPEYMQLSEAEEEDVGGDAAEFSYLVRTINEVIDG